jgi:hypothetical protein
MSMTNNEKKMMVALGKSLVHQLDVNLELMKLLPFDKGAELRAAQDKIESELDKFIRLIGTEWGLDEED